MILVDTGIWYASASPASPDHIATIQLIREHGADFLTTDYIIDETLTLLRSRGRATAALAMGERFFSGQLAAVHHVSEAEVRDAWQIFRQFNDKDWSFTDCVSYVVAQRLGISTALSLDHHFRQFGTLAVLP